MLAIKGYIHLGFKKAQNNRKTRYIESPHSVINYKKRKDYKKIRNSYFMFCIE